MEIVYMLNLTHKKLQKCLLAHVFHKVRMTNLVHKFSSNSQILIVSLTSFLTSLEETWATKLSTQVTNSIYIYRPRSQVLPYEVEATIAIVFDSQNHKLYGGDHISQHPPIVNTLLSIGSLIQLWMSNEPQPSYSVSTVVTNLSGRLSYSPPHLCKWVSMIGNVIRNVNGYYTSRQVITRQVDACGWLLILYH